MRREQLAVVVFGALGGLLAFGCYGSSTDAGAGGGAGATPADGGSASSASSGLPCDVDAVLEKSCRSCHGAAPKYGAPMPLVSYADLVAPAKSDPSKKMFEVVRERIHDDTAPMPQAPNPRLSSSEAAAIDAWVSAGAPSSTESCDAGGGGATSTKPLGCTPDQKLRPSAKFEMTGEDDTYVCYGFDTTTEMRRHVIAGAPHVDNPNIVHHILLYQADSTVSSTPTKCGVGGSPTWRLVTGWAPGGKNFELPPEAGFAEEAGTTHWALQIHYNNAQGLAGQVDASGYDLCTTDQLRPNDADILATGTVKIDIPPRATQTTTCDFEVPDGSSPIKIISSWPHMHKLGRAQYAKRVRGAEEVSILDEPNFDHALGGTAGEVDVDVASGDTIRTTCKWQNPGDTSVKFGEATEDEMCFAFLTYYPKISSDKFHWALPATPLLSKCTTVNE